MKSTILFIVKQILCTTAIFLCTYTVNAQSVGIGTSNPNPSARLEINSTNQGILIPALTTTERNAINNPAKGLLVFQRDGTEGFYFYNGVNWVNLTTGYQPNERGIAVSPTYGLTTTVAGDRTGGSDDGPASTASFDRPTGVAVDGFGNIYVADHLNNKIRKISPLGVVSTFAGTGAAGHRDGAHDFAMFNSPWSITVDASGNVYVGEFSRYVRKITPNGEVSTLAGNGSAGSDDGVGSSASFSLPAGLAVDGSGNVYVADEFSFKIRKITREGMVSTFVGGEFGYVDGTATQAKFKHLVGLTIDGMGNLYVGDVGNRVIRKITPSGEVSTLAGGGPGLATDGIGTAASFNNPLGVAVDAYGNAYVVDDLNTTVRKITSNGVVSTVAGSRTRGANDGLGTAATFQSPTGICLDASGNLYVADWGNFNIRKVITH